MKRIIFILILLFMVGAVSAATPYLMDQQGVLRNATNGTVIDGNYEVNITIYKDVDDSAIYAENATLSMVNGVWDYYIGNTYELDPTAFKEPLYIETKINGESLGWVNITWNPYSFFSLYSNDTDYFGSQSISYFGTQANQTIILTNVSVNTNNITDIRGLIATTTLWSNISDNTNAIGQLAVNITNLGNNVSVNTNSIGQLGANISSLAGNVSQNSDNITTNRGLIDSMANETDTNCNATGSCNTVAYMDYDNQGNFNISENLTVEDSIFLEDADHRMSISYLPLDSIANSSFMKIHTEEHVEGAILECTVYAPNDNITDLRITDCNQVGRNNSVSYRGNSQFIGPNNICSGPSFSNDTTCDMSNVTNIFRLYDHFNVSPFFSADTSGYGATLFVQGGLDIWRQTRLREGVLSSGPADFVMEGNDFNIDNGSLHIQIPTEFISGFNTSQERILMNENFEGTLGQFMNEPTNVLDWFTASGPLCSDGQCANAQGAGSDIIMDANISTTDVDNITLRFVYSLVALSGSDAFTVTVNNNSGSGFVDVFTDAGTDTQVTEIINLSSFYANVSTLTIRVNCDAVIATRTCHIDQFVVNSTSLVDNTALVSGVNSEICFSDGVRGADGNCTRGLFYSARDDLTYGFGPWNITGSGGSGITGSGTANNVAKFTGAGTSVGNSNIVDDGTNVVIGSNTNITGQLNATGKIAASSFGLDSVIDSWTDINGTNAENLTVSVWPKFVEQDTEIANIASQLINDTNLTYGGNIDGNITFDVGNLTLAGTNYGFDTRNSSIWNSQTGYGNIDLPVTVNDNLNITYNVTILSSYLCNATDCFTLTQLNTTGSGVDLSENVSGNTNSIGQLAVNDTNIASQLVNDTNLSYGGNIDGNITFDVGNLTLAGTNYGFDTRNSSIWNSQTGYGGIDAPVTVNDNLNITYNVTILSSYLCNATECFTLTQLNTTGSGTDLSANLAALSDNVTSLANNVSEYRTLLDTNVTNLWGSITNLGSDSLNYSHNRSIIHNHNISWLQDNQNYTIHSSILTAMANLTLINTNITNLWDNLNNLKTNVSVNTQLTGLLAVNITNLGNNVSLNAQAIDNLAIINGTHNVSLQTKLQNDSHSQFTIANVSDTAYIKYANVTGNITLSEDAVQKIWRNSTSTIISGTTSTLVIS